MGSCNFNLTPKHHDEFLDSASMKGFHVESTLDKVFQKAVAAAIHIECVRWLSKLESIK